MTTQPDKAAQDLFEEAVGWLCHRYASYTFFWSGTSLDGAVTGRVRDRRARSPLPRDP